MPLLEYCFGCYRIFPNELLKIFKQKKYCGHCAKTLKCRREFIKSRMASRSFHKIKLRLFDRDINEISENYYDEEYQYLMELRERYWRFKERGQFLLKGAIN